MEKKDIRKYCAKRIKELDKDWNAEAEKDTRKKPVDYLVIGAIQGKIDAFMEILTKLTP